MENNNIVVAKRGSARSNITGSLSTLILFSAFLVIDIIFYIRDKSTWQLVLSIISSVLVVFAILGFLFNIAHYRYSKKVADKPLIEYDQENNVFIVMDCLFKKEVMINKDDVIEIKTSEKGETYLWYNKNLKKSSIFIGYSNKSSQDLINNEIQKYKNLY